MAKTSLRFQERANDQRCYDYTRWANERYWETHRRPLNHWDYQGREYDEPTVDLPRIHGLYAQGIEWGYLNTPYPSFEIHLTGITPSVKREYSPYYHRWYWSRGDTPKSSYRRNPSHKKKNKENPWREHKKTKKDKSRSYCFRRASKDDKKVSNRYHRSWVRQEIHRENWEIFHRKEKVKKNVDWW